MGKWAVRNHLPAVSTFSIVARDALTGELAVAVQSKFLSVGAVVPWAAANVGAIATQSWANTEFGPRGLAMLQEGQDPSSVIETLIKDDEERDFRQVGIVDKFGRSATYTGVKCFHFAGGIAGENFACQGNILADEAVVKQMAESYRNANPKDPLPERLIRALTAGQSAGGDVRGMQSAALYVVKTQGGYGGFNDRYIDLRVDDHRDPITELGRLLELHRLYFERSKPEDLLPIEGALLKELRDLLGEMGYTPGAGVAYDAATRGALQSYFLRENFDERWTEDPVIDSQVLDYLRRAAHKN